MFHHLQVQQKLKTDTYEDIEELSADIELLVNNAKAFYKPDSVEYKDAIELWRIYTQNRLSLESGRLYWLVLLAIARYVYVLCYVFGFRTCQPTSLQNSPEEDQSSESF